MQLVCIRWDKMMCFKVLSDLSERPFYLHILTRRLLVEKLGVMGHSLQAMNQLLVKRMLKVPVKCIYVHI